MTEPDTPIYIDQGNGASRAEMKETTESEIPRNAGEYWQMPTPGKQGDTTASGIYTAVGQALTEWELVESIFALLFRTFMGGSYPAERVFGTIVSNAAKRQALGAATAVVFVENSVSDEDQKAWKLLEQHYERASTRRMEVAHGVVTDWHGERSSGHFLVPAPHMTRKTDPRQILPPEPNELDSLGAYRYTARDLLEFATRFRQLRGWAWHFMIAYQHSYQGRPLPVANASANAV